MIQHSPLALRCRCQSLDEPRKHLGVVPLYLDQSVQLLRVVAVVGERMKGFGNTEVRVRAHTRFAIHGERNDAREISLERKSHQIEHQPEVLGDVVGPTDRRVRNVQCAGILPGGHLDTPFNLADRVQVITDEGAVTDPKAGFEPGGLSLDAIQNATGLGENRRTFFRGVALAEQLIKHRARISFLWQGLCRRAPGQSRSHLRGREFERRQARVLADMPCRYLVGSNACLPDQ